MKGLIIKQPWIDLILDGEKPWEIRGRATTIRGTIALIKSGTGLVLGLVDVVDSLELTPDTFYQAEVQHGLCRIRGSMPGVGASPTPIGATTLRASSRRRHLGQSADAGHCSLRDVQWSRFQRATGGFLKERGGLNG